MEQARRKSSRPWTAAVALLFLFAAVGVVAAGAGAPSRILVDTDMDTEDLFALLYISKQDRSKFDVKAITINANAWVDAGHGVNQLYDILYMMGRDDIAVGVGGDGGISDAGEIHSDVGGYLPLLDQGMSTAGGCRYRQAIPRGATTGAWTPTPTPSSGGASSLGALGSTSRSGSPQRSR
ncbi:hypothetical protein ZWY2020_043279 [Hordeum vulgare]|nr:hypothetical protein ZWY2020_043279 [Hordeum vulgare]